MKLGNIVNFEINYDFHKLKLNLDGVSGWLTKEYWAEERYETEGGEGRAFQASRGSIEGLFWTTNLFLQIDDVSQDRSQMKIKVTVSYPEQIQTLYQAKEQSWKSKVMSIDAKVSELIISLEGRILED